MTIFADLGPAVGLLSGDVQAAVVVAAAHVITLAGWGLRLRWQTRTARRQREDVIAILRELPAGSRLESTGRDGTVLRVDLPDDPSITTSTAAMTSPSSTPSTSSEPSPSSSTMVGTNRS
jgi:hypothetical protein